MSFGRVRIRANGGLCPDTTYRVVTPYGEQEVTTDVDGALQAVAEHLRHRLRPGRPVGPVRLRARAAQPDRGRLPPLGPGHRTRGAGRLPR